MIKLQLKKKHYLKKKELQQEIDNLRSNEKKLFEAQTMTIRLVTEQNDLLKLQLNMLGTQIMDRGQKLLDYQSIIDGKTKETEEERKLMDERLHEEIVKVRNSRDIIKDLKQVVQGCTCKDYNEEEGYNADYEEYPANQEGPANEENRDPGDNEGAAAAIAGTQRLAEPQYATLEEVQRLIVQHTSPVPDPAVQAQQGVSQLTQLTAVINENANKQLKEVVTPLMENFTEFTKKMFDKQNGMDPATANLISLECSLEPQTQSLCLNTSQDSRKNLMKLGQIRKKFIWQESTWIQGKISLRV